MGWVDFKFIIIDNIFRCLYHIKEVNPCEKENIFINGSNFFDYYIYNYML